MLMQTKVSMHVETVVLLSQLRQKPDDYIEVEETLSLCGLAGFSSEYVPVFLAGENVYRK